MMVKSKFFHGFFIPLAPRPLRLGHYGFQPNPWWTHGNVKKWPAEESAVALAGSYPRWIVPSGKHTKNH